MWLGLVHVTTVELINNFVGTVNAINVPVFVNSRKSEFDRVLDCVL